MASLEVVKVLSEMKPGTHAVLIYDSPAHKRDILLSHMKLGMYDAKLNYVCSDDTPQDVEEEMSAAGINVPLLKREGRLEIDTYDKVYMLNGKVDVASMIGHFAYLAVCSRRDGLDGGVRIAGEMSCFFRDKMIDHLVTFERRLHRTFPFPAIGLWAYDVTELSNSGHLEPLVRLFHAQNPVIFAGPKGETVLMPEDTSGEKPAREVLQVRR